MSLRKSFALLAAVMLAALQGCENPQTTAPGDRSSEGVGSVAFRLSEQNVAYLQTQALYMQYEVSGPGMDTIYQSSALDTTPVFLNGIPCGTRIVRVDVIDMFGAISWTGADTVEINPNRTTMAHVVLHRPMQLGGLLIDVTLDSASLADTTFDHPRFDTIWTRQYVPGNRVDSSFNCYGPYQVSQNLYQMQCVEQIQYVARFDTTWTDTITRRAWDTLNTQCWQTSWIDSIQPRDSAIKYSCTRFHYLPYASYDTIWKDTTVGTKSLNNYKWCSPSFWSNDSTLECRTGKYKKLPAGTCELVSFYSGDRPFATRYPCKDSLLYNPPKDS